MKKILVIEDEDPLREEILSTLECLDFECKGAENGLLGVQEAYKYLPDLIICDILMPELDGYGVLKNLRDNPETAVIPLIFLSAKAEKSDIRKGMNLGAEDYLTKPFTIDELEDAIVACLDKQARRKRALEMMQANEENLHKLAEQEELLNNLTKQLRNSREIKSVLKSTLLAIRNLLKTHRCSFLFYRGDVENPYFELIDESIDPEMAKISQSNLLEKISALGEIILEFNRLQINDISTDTQLDSSSRENLASLGLSSLIAVSIQIPSGEVGVVVCEHFNEPRPWSNNEVELLQAIADQLPIAL